MSMKLPLTDKFLWELYNVLESLDRAHQPFAHRSMRAVASPEWYKLKKSYERQQAKRAFSQFIYYLKSQGYIISTGSGEGVLLTSKGEQKALRAKLKLVKERPRRDGKLIMAFFDIPEKKRPLRDLFRDFLVAMGYKKLQQSVWMCANDALEETERIVREYELERYVKLFLIKSIEL